MRTVLVIIVLLCIGCLSKKTPEFVPAHSRKVAVKLMDSLGIINLHSRKPTPIIPSVLHSRQPQPELHHDEKAHGSILSYLRLKDSNIIRVFRLFSHIFDLLKGSAHFVLLTLAIHRLLFITTDLTKLAALTEIHLSYKTVSGVYNQPPIEELISIVTRKPVLSRVNTCY